MASAIAISAPSSFPRLPDLRRRSAWISRKLGLLLAHALIAKITAMRYQLTSTGRKTIVAALSALRSTVVQLSPVTAQLTAVAALDAMKNLCKRKTF